MIDRFGRTIDYLRISVTDRCNLRCRYCMPPSGVPLVAHESVLRFEEIVEVARCAIELGVKKIRLTGGEPLVRRHVVDLVRMLAPLQGLEDLSMTTNGLLLAQFAPSLAEAGLQRVNVSLDAIDPKEYAEITYGGDVQKVFEGIEAARQAGLKPIKINCVTGTDGDGRNARDVAAFAEREGLIIRFIKQMDLAEGRFHVVVGGHGGDCPRCNRLRLTSDGQIRPCLFSNTSFSVRRLGAAKALCQAIAHKPEAGSVCTERPMHTIGG